VLIYNSTDVNLSSSPWVRLSQTVSSSNFSDFYSSECWAWKNCILKISPIENMFINDVNSTVIPYLEYQIRVVSGVIPTRFTNINASGKSFGFQKNFNVKVPQITVDQAFDFTVFQ